MRKFLYYLLACTWGILMTLAGGVVAACLLIAGKKPEKCGPCIRFKVGENWGGVSLGLVILTDTTSRYSIVYHEFGHTLQNAVLGPFFIFLVAIPSAIRYWIFIYREKHNKTNPDYDAVWFEGTATRYGNKYFYKFE